MNFDPKKALAARRTVTDLEALVKRVYPDLSTDGVEVPAALSEADAYQLLYYTVEAISAEDEEVNSVYQKQLKRADEEVRSLFMDLAQFVEQYGSAIGYVATIGFQAGICLLHRRKAEGKITKSNNPQLCKWYATFTGNECKD